MSGVYDERACLLGEGPLWHPRLSQLFWFDILAKRLYTRGAGGPAHWQFAEHVSAAGWVDDQTLLIASESALFRFDLVTAARQDLVSLEGDNRLTRSNDGRADPSGGFWIGTMGTAGEPGAGAIYRYFRGELRRLFAGISIPNAICFPPDGRSAHFCDTATGCVMRVALDALGWPAGEPQVFIDLRAERRNPDGAVVDASGVLWLAEWGSARVAAYDPAGQFLRAVTVAAPNSSCPAFGGADFSTLFCTSAQQSLSAGELAAHPQSGMTFCAPDVARGQPEHQVIL